MHGCSWTVAVDGRVVAADAVGTTPSIMGEGGMLPPNTPIAPRTIFITASVTKPLVAIACMQLVEAGRLALDIPVAALVPAFVGNQKASVTVRHLLTHTSGIPDTAVGVDRTAHATLADHTRGICAMPLLFRPGTYISYSSAAFHLLAVIVEAVSGQPLPEYLRDAVFTPLGMHDTTLGIPTDRKVERESAMNREIPTGMNGEQLYPNKDSLAIAREVATAGVGASGYSRYGHNSAYWRTLGAAWAGLLTTSSDLAHLYQVLACGGKLGDGPRILRSTTVCDMIHCHTHGLCDYVQPHDNAAHDGPFSGSTPSSQWGLGFRLNRGVKKFGEAGAENTFGHHGGAGAMSWADPESGTSFVCLTTEPTMCYSAEFNELSDIVHLSTKLERFQSLRTHQSSPTQAGPSPGAYHVGTPARNKLSTEQLSDYTSSGYCHCKGWFTPEEVALLRSAIESDPELASHEITVPDASGLDTRLALWMQLGDDTYSTNGT
jgi:CubicO group peptidase (beta-lactamase class C family)